MDRRRDHPDDSEEGGGRTWIVILRKRLLTLVGTRVLSALVVLVAILQILDLLDVTNDILQRNLGIGGVAYYAFLRTPDLIEQVAPVAVLAGCIFAFIQLARENAVVALRAAGVSAYQLVGVIAPAALAVLALDLACAQWLSPRAEEQLDAWWAKSAPPAETPAKPPTRSFRVGSDIVVATQDGTAGRRLSNVSIYRRAPDGRLLQRVRAGEAVYQGDGWRLIEPSFDVLGAKVIEQGRNREIVWTPGPRPQDVRGIFTNAQSLAPGSARRALAGGVSARPPAFYSTALQRSWSAPLAAVVMLLIAAPVLLINFRSGGASTVVWCLCGGLIFLVVDGVFTALGEGGNVPAVLGAWSASAIFAAASATVLLHLEG
jgi:lipopolysaccharide export system permease protein